MTNEIINNYTRAFTQTRCNLTILAKVIICFNISLHHKLLKTIIYAEYINIDRLKKLSMKNMIFSKLIKYGVIVCFEKKSQRSY